MILRHYEIIMVNFIPWPMEDMAHIMSVQMMICPNVTTMLMCIMFEIGCVLQNYLLSQPTMSVMTMVHTNYFLNVMNSLDVSKKRLYALLKKIA